jgi:plastocyanin
MKRVRIMTFLALTGLTAGLGIYMVAASAQNDHKMPGSAASTPSGPLSNATVSFGAWMMPLNRFPNVPPPPSANHHLVAPTVATIKAGGAVNFIIAGLHQVVVYDHGTTPEDIDTSLIAPAPPPPAPQPPVVDDPDGRLYRGPDPRVLFPNVDRVEVVHFGEPGTYLVICGVLPHFQQGMYGYVKVLP